jgi:hypothetical protein
MNTPVGPWTTKINALQSKKVNLQKITRKSKSTSYNDKLARAESPLRSFEDLFVL